MKQQKLIQKFINDELLNQKIFLLQNKILLDIIKNTKNKTPNQIKTLNIQFYLELLYIRL